MRRERGFGALALTLLASLSLAACGDNGGQPTNRGDLLVAYYQGGPEPGALLVTITGGAVENVTAVGGQVVSFASPASGTTRVVVMGSFTTGDLLRLRVPDIALSTNYAVRVEQVADKVTYALIDPTKYTFTVHR